MSKNGDENTTSVSKLTINFNAPGAADFTQEISNVTPAQMLGAAEWLRWYALKAFDSQLIKQAQKQAQNQIQIPIGALDKLKKGPH